MENEIQENLEIEDESPELSPEEYLETLLIKARTAVRPLSGLIAMKKNVALLAMADGLLENEERLLDANQKDVEAFEGDESRGPLVDRLRLTPTRIADMAKQLREIAELR
ncbi:MAG: gamma-glutamyl-phosphate reductase, partial [Nitrospirales bacterium]|nr:gamma-glutamyl-phosphate reductase [Nitrospirales bacterium]